ncbi:AEC family transporter [Paracoccus thiocyanatus]|uniref:AEC family transporter n=1 Tax=Paracoccus thiocyanatus TaxID=34006 RepID=A0A3D8P866_9RHOB|nr:AEC family transporter [Paracoccus thiocyanatus]RDW12280.1 AEC family transporter [Paracoccus thiocyanatus]
MTALFDVILPVFLVVGFGYLVCWRKWLSEVAVDGVMRFAQNFALPVLLFGAIAGLDLGANYKPLLLLAFYSGALLSFALGTALSLYWLRRPAEDAIAIGFVCLFSNSLLLGVPITERAYGPEAVLGNFTIISIHSPLLYTFGITAMEFVRARGQNLSLGGVALRALSGVLHTPLVIGILCGFAVNLSMQAGLVLPQGFWAAVKMMSNAALPAALFGLGGVLYRYRPEGEARAIALCCGASLLLHPAVTFGLGKLFALNLAEMRSAVLTAAMPPGVNAYIFAALYGVAKRVSASAVLVATALSVLTVWFWLAVLP